MDYRVEDRSALTNTALTPAMIEAGAEALRELDWDGRCLRVGEARVLAKLVLEAAFCA